MTSLPFSEPVPEIVIIKNESEKRSAIKSIMDGATVSSIYINPVQQEIKHIAFVIEGIQTDLLDFFFQRFLLTKKINQYTVISLQPVRKKIIKEERNLIEQLKKRFGTFGFIKSHDTDIKSIIYALGRNSSNTLIVMRVSRTQLSLLHKKAADIIFSGNHSILLLLKK